MKKKKNFDAKFVNFIWWDARLRQMETNDGTIIVKISLKEIFSKGLCNL